MRYSLTDTCSDLTSQPRFTTQQPPLCSEVWLEQETLPRQNFHHSIPSYDLPQQAKTPLSGFPGLQDPAPPVVSSLFSLTWVLALTPIFCFLLRVSNYGHPRKNTPLCGLHVSALTNSGPIKSLAFIHHPCLQPLKSETHPSKPLFSEAAD